MTSPKCAELECGITLVVSTMSFCERAYFNCYFNCGCLLFMCRIAGKKNPGNNLLWDYSLRTSFNIRAISQPCVCACHVFARQPCHNNSKQKQSEPSCTADLVYLRAEHRLPLFFYSSTDRSAGAGHATYGLVDTSFVKYSFV